MKIVNNLPKPFCGRMLIEAIKDDAMEHVKKQIHADTGASLEFLKNFEIADPKLKNKHTPITKGIIVDMAPDAFGKAFQDRYGDDMEYPVLGDTVWFIANENYRVDSEGKYHLISDDGIVGFKRKEDYTR
jgi:hypothetical protein